MTRVDTGILHLAGRSKPLISPTQKALPAHDRDWFSGVGGSLHKSLSRYYTRAAVDETFHIDVGRDVVVVYIVPEQWSRS